ncbi:MAG: D-alanine--D-alanine ligase family protein [Armatimonadota bacterium]|jgi:D-alanine-D-alanine ligase
MSVDLLRDRRIAVLMGGQSGEREVSLRSGAGVLASLQRQGFDAVQIDPGRNLVAQLEEARAEVVVNVLHGGAGENGAIQGVLECAGYPYTGCGVLASALTMDKVQTKRIFGACAIPTPPWLHIDGSRGADDFADEAIERFGLPVVIKPRDEGSSLGVSIPKTREQLIAATDSMQRDWGEGLIDRFIEGVEVTIGVVGVGERMRALPVLELVPKREFYDYEAKYTKGMTELIAPARISDELTAKSQRIALEAFVALGCEGLGRVDMHIDRDGNCWVHEINSVPGMTETSDLPHAAEAEDVSYDELVLQILETATARM